MTDNDVIERLKEIVKQAKTYRRAAEWLSVDHTHLYRVIHGQKRPGKAILGALGLEEQGRVYRRVKQKRIAPLT